MADSSESAADNRSIDVVKEGWLQKRGEFIKNWRPRWFVLYSDGTFQGYKNKRTTVQQEVLNNFKIDASAHIIANDKIKKNGFIIRCLQLTTFIERNLSAETDIERGEWIVAMEDVKAKLRISQEAEDKRALANAMKKSTTTPAADSTTAGPQKKMEDFEILKVLGKGTFGKVVLCQDKATEEVFAMKILKKDVIVAKDEVAHTLTENRILQTTKHPFLTSLRYSFQTADRLCFVMEYVNGGELFFHLSRERVFTEERSRFYAGEIILAIEYLHSLGVVYRDLKLENLLLDSEGHIKLTDFGLCKEDITYGATTKTFCGTPEYLAPEVLEDSDYGRSVDWWGVGVVMYEMICGRLPFYSRDHEVLFEMILVEQVQFPARISTLSKSVLSGLLTKNPTKRLGGGPGDAEEVKSHSFFEGLNFQDLYDRKIDAPFKPEISSSTDVKYFDDMFTKEEPELTPPDSNDPKAGIGKDVHFEDFSFNIKKGEHLQ